MGGHAVGVVQVTEIEIGKRGGGGDDRRAAGGTMSGEGKERGMEQSRGIVEVQDRRGCWASDSR